MPLQTMSVHHQDALKGMLLLVKKFHESLSVLGFLLSTPQKQLAAALDDLRTKIKEKQDMIGGSTVYPHH